MVFEWDEEKDTINQKKHGISFKDARYVFADPFAVTRDDFTDSEHRKQIMGHIGGTLLVLVVYSMKNRQGKDVFRIISARKATAAERRNYEAGKWF
ncbi:MAG: BrnT family toxin [Spirochaetales bacterium]|nr:BrnT family toxin [Spirochaetales bacterium]